VVSLECFIDIILPPRTMTLGSTQSLTEMSKRLTSPYNRPPRAQRGNRGISLLILDLDARRGGWSGPRPGRFTSGKDPVSIVQEAEWDPDPLWTCAKNLAPTRIRSPDRPVRSQSPYRLSYPAQNRNEYQQYFLGVKAAGA
jgi:hypothetical protein